MHAHVRMHSHMNTRPSSTCTITCASITHTDMHTHTCVCAHNALKHINTHARVHTTPFPPTDSHTCIHTCTRTHAYTHQYTPLFRMHNDLHKHSTNRHAYHIQFPRSLFPHCISYLFITIDSCCDSCLPPIACTCTLYVCAYAHSHTRCSNLTYCLFRFCAVCVL